LELIQLQNLVQRDKTLYKGSMKVIENGSKEKQKYRVSKINWLAVE
jgi:hypothetical protein